MNLDVPEAQTPGWKEPSSAACEGREGARAHPGIPVHPHPITRPSRSMGWSCWGPSLPLATVQRGENYLPHSILETTEPSVRMGHDGSGGRHLVGCRAWGALEGRSLPWGSLLT